MGYVSKVTGAPHDKGIDVIIEKEGIISYIQCKRYINNEVNVHALRDFYGAIVNDIEDGGRGYMITLKGFTRDAKEFAEEKPLELIDAQKLINYIRQTEIF